MRTLYLDCSMGAAGDMLMAALLELHPQPEDFLRRMNALGLPGVTLTAQRAVKCGIQGTHVSVLIHGEEEDDALDQNGHMGMNTTMDTIMSTHMSTITTTGISTIMSTHTSTTTVTGTTATSRFQRSAV